MSSMQKVGTHKTNIIIDSLGEGQVQYHRTLVVHWTVTRITLDSGGHRKKTTKLRMNQASNEFSLEYQVFQRDFEWFVRWKGQILDFEDGMVLTR